LNHGALPEVRGLRARIEKELPFTDVTEVDDLEFKALAVSHAHALFVVATKPAMTLPELVDRRRSHSRTSLRPPTLPIRSECLCMFAWATSGLSASWASAVPLYARTISVVGACPRNVNSRWSVGEGPLAPVKVRLS
jgi:hypothetical protein